MIQNSLCTTAGSVNVPRSGIRFALYVVGGREDGGRGQGAGGRGREVQNFPLPRVPFNPDSHLPVPFNPDSHLPVPFNPDSHLPVPFNPDSHLPVPFNPGSCRIFAGSCQLYLLREQNIKQSYVKKCMQKGIRRSLLCRLYCILLNQGCLCLLCPQKCISERNGPKTSPVSTTCQTGLYLGIAFY